MNSRKIALEIERLAKARDWAEDDPRYQHLAGLYYEREMARDGLLRRIASLRHDLDNLEHALQQPDRMLNTLGELQSRPSAVEAGVGYYEAARKVLAEYLKTFPPLEVTTNARDQH